MLPVKMGQVKKCHKMLPVKNGPKNVASKKGPLYVAKSFAADI